MWSPNQNSTVKHPEDLMLWGTENDIGIRIWQLLVNAMFLKLLNISVTKSELK